MYTSVNIQNALGILLEGHTTNNNRCSTAISMLRNVTVSNGMVPPTCTGDFPATPPRRVCYVLEVCTILAAARVSHG